ncbi:unnamed protein product, partial [Didymodactylos carnosus]
MTAISNIASPFEKIEHIVTLQLLNQVIAIYDPKREKHIQEIFNMITGLEQSEFEISNTLQKWNFVLPIYEDSIINNRVNIPKTAEIYFESQPGFKRYWSNILLPTRDNCCNTSLRQPEFGKNVTIYACDGPKKYSLMKRRCAICENQYFPNYVLKSDALDYTDHESFRHIILIFGIVVYSRELINRFDGDLLFKHSGFEAFQQSYAYELSINGLHDITHFDRRHFQLTWMFYKAAESMYKRGVHYVQIPFERDIDLFLWNSLASALESFCDRWSRHVLNNPCGPQCSK